jgi:hypothetical protein
MALDLGYFVCMGKVYRQDRGAIIGGHASPALCALAVTFKEFVWQKAYGIQMGSHLLCIRYVDNRFTAVEEHLLQHAAYQRFMSMDFYDPPVELEPCGNNVLLGYELDFYQFTCKYVVPTETYEFRSAHSAGSIHRTLSGLTARLHLLYRGTYPRSLAASLVKELLAGYVRSGFDRQILRKISFRVSSMYGE